MTGRPIRDIGDRDVSWILDLNGANVEHTSPLEPASLRLMLGDAFHARAIGENEGFIIPFDQTSAYASANYHWFRDRYSEFVYIDRIVIAASARKAGLARALYEDLFAAALRSGRKRIGCEVNVISPNPTSDAFHARLGFVEVGQSTLANGKTVRYLLKELP